VYKVKALTPENPQPSFDLEGATFDVQDGVLERFLTELSSKGVTRFLLSIPSGEEAGKQLPLKDSSIGSQNNPDESASQVESHLRNEPAT